MKSPATATTTDYGTWKLLAWCGPVFFVTFFFMWGVLAGNLPPAGANLTPEQIWTHYIDNGTAIRIGMSVCMVGGAFYMVWGLAVSRVMRRIEGPEGMLSSLEMMGATITCAPIIIACGIWLTASIEAPALSKEIVHLLYWLGWMIIDLAYMVTSFQILASSLVFLKDPREKPLVPAWVCWWGFVTFASFFPVSLVPFLKTGPFAFNGLFNFWIAFFTWYIWITSLSIYIIKAVRRIEIEDGAASPTSETAQRGGVMVGAR